MNQQTFWTYDPVRKVKGYVFEGLVRSAFTNKAGQWRYVVENESAEGMLHIFSAEQLERMPCLK